MSRAVQAFNAVENRIDRGKTAERRREADAIQAETARSIMSGALGGLTPQHAYSQALAIANAALDEAAKLQDPEGVVAWCGFKACQIGRPLEGARTIARSAAEQVFVKETAQ